jgi:quaternary ammonium compound-resistance protein SugE
MSGTARLFEGRAVMAWIVLFAAGLLETVWAVGMKLSHGFTRPMPSAITVAAMIGSVVLLAWAMRTLPLGTAYAVWTGIGTVGAFAAGVAFLGEDGGPLRLTAAAVIVAGLVLMKIASPG